MNPQLEFDRQMTRRQLLSHGRSGLGAAALASLLNADLGQASAAESGSHGLSELPHFTPKAKRVIYLFMAGGRVTSTCSITNRRCEKFTVANCPNQFGRDNDSPE